MVAVAIPRLGDLPRFSRLPRHFGCGGLEAGPHDRQLSGDPIAPSLQQFMNFATQNWLSGWLEQTFV
jgi:hypothetical protein